MSIATAHPFRPHVLVGRSVPGSPAAVARASRAAGPRPVRTQDVAEHAAPAPLGSRPVPSGRDAQAPSSRRSRSASPSSSGRVRSVRLTARGRLAVLLLLSLAALLTAAVVGVLADAHRGSSPPMSPVAVRQVTVMPGQTLWSIAADTEPRGDIRDRIVEIRTLNGMESSSLVAGQQLMVPLD